MVIPYAASCRWYGEWLRGRMEGLSDADACDRASSLTVRNPRDLRRTQINSNHGPTLLSVAVAKGPGLILSDHGNWPHIHLGALNAEYGRFPFFQFIIDDIATIYSPMPQNLPELNLRIHSMICRWLDMESFIGHCRDLPVDDTVFKRGMELKTKVNLNLSILDAIFRFGKNTPLILLGTHDGDDDK